MSDRERGKYNEKRVGEGMGWKERRSRESARMLRILRTTASAYLRLFKNGVDVVVSFRIVSRAEFEQMRDR